MTKNRIAALTAACCVSAAGLAAWTATAVANQQGAQAQARPTAVAIVNPIKVLDGLEERTVLEEQLVADIRSREQRLQEVADRVKALQSDIQALGQRGTPEYRQKTAELYVLRNQLQSSAQAEQEILSRQRGDILRDMYQKIAAASQKIAERRGYDAVLLDDSVFPLPDEANDRDIERLILSRTIVYASPSIDITQDVVTLMNSDYRAGGGRAPANAPAAGAAQGR